MQHTRTGLLVPPNAMASLAQGLARLAQDPTAFRVMGPRAGGWLGSVSACGPWWRVLGRY